MKPADYRHSCTVSHDIPYSVADSSTKESQPALGILHVGRVVWLDHDLVNFAGRTLVRAYADGIGLIQINPQSLSATCKPSA